MNAAPRKALRPYQARLIADVCRSDGHVLVEQPTGSGKTMQIVTLVAMQLGKRFTHAVIAAPQQQIEHAFVHPDYRLIRFPICQGAAAPDIEVPQGLILGARNSKQLNSASRLIAYLRHSGPQDYALACTHAALNRLTSERMPQDLSGKALFIDEAHHASADGLSEIVSLWEERGGQLYFFTATPYRGDGRPVALDGMRLYRRSLAEHMAEGFAPRHLESEIVALGHRGDRITAGQFTGEEAPPASYFDELVASVSRRWMEDGRPKAIVRVPPMRGGSGGLVARLIHALAANDARVLDATGIGVADKTRFLDALAAEKNRSHEDSRYDVIVGIQRVMEGTDWPVCAAVYCVGMPGSLNTVVQLLGRAMRLKGQDYPEQHKDLAQLVFFVPCGGGSALPELSIDHSRHALLTCCFLADHEIGQEWIVLREIHRGIEEALGPVEQNPAAADAENEANEALDPEVRAEIELVMASARDQIIANGGEATLGEVVQLAVKNRPDLPEPALLRVAAEILAAQPGRSGAKARDAIHQEMARRLRIDPMVKKAMEEAFAVVLDEFRAVTLEESVVLESVGRQVHGVTGGQMRQFAQRLREAAPRPLTEEMILAWADAYYERIEHWPIISSGPILDAPGDTWLGIDMALRQGHRGLPGGASLAKLLEKNRDVRNLQNLPLLPKDQILAWADAHHERTGKWPGRNSGPVADASGELWVNVDAALRIGLRGLPSGSSLPTLLYQERGVRNEKRPPGLSIEQILAWADSHFAKVGSWPTRESGPIEDSPGETWLAVEIALRNGGRGFSGGSSLPIILAEHRGVRNVGDLPPLTKERILTWADAHRDHTGEWPNHESGPVNGVSGETWKGIHMALVKGMRGLPGDSSLAQLLAEERGVRNRKRLPKLTCAQILEWADKHHERTGEWPTKKTGMVIESPGETWSAIHAALAKGTRGLPGESSLPQLLAERRGAPNRMRLPRLTIDRILAWADAHFQATGEWPTRRSGNVVGAFAEHWDRIDYALREGSRSLPGGSSLSQLLNARRGVRNPASPPPLTIAMIVRLADQHHEQTGTWPTATSGKVIGAIKETWAGINAALREGLRGLLGGSSLHQLLTEHLRKADL